MERALRGDRKRWESKTQERGRDSERGQRFGMREKGEKGGGRRSPIHFCGCGCHC